MNETTEAQVAALSERLNALVASWEVAIAARRLQRATDSDGALREPAAVLAELERELNDIERHCDEHRQAVDAKAREAREWEARAMLAITQKRDALARDALTRQQQYAAAAEAAAGETTALEAVRDAYRNAVAAVRAITCIDL